MRTKLTIFLPLIPFLLIGFLFALVIDAPRTDYLAHIQFAKDMLAAHWPQSPHFIYQIVLVLVSKLFGIPLGISNARLITTAMVFLSGVIIYLSFFEKESPKNNRARIINICAVSGILISMPVPLFYFFDKSLYFGYISMNVLHNPTVVMLKPTAILLFLLFCKNMMNNENRKIPLISALVIISALVKPNFIMCFIPAVLIYFILKKNKNRQLFISVSCIVVPGILVLLWQFLFTYTGTPNGGGIQLSPFFVYKIYSNLWKAPFKLLLSIAFPLSILIFYWQEIKNNFMIQFSVLLFLISLAFFYLMAEYPVPNSGNFWWGSQVTLFIVFISTTSYFTTKILNPALTNNSLNILRQKNISIPLLLFFSHIIAGIYYYYDTFSGGVHW